MHTYIQQYEYTLPRCILLSFMKLNNSSDIGGHNWSFPGRMMCTALCHVFISIEMMMPMMMMMIVSSSIYAHVKLASSLCIHNSHCMYIKTSN